VATLHYAGGTARSVFTPISAPLGSISNAAGTMVVLAHQSAATGNDMVGVTDAAATATAWYRAFGIRDTLWSPANTLWDDVGGNDVTSSTAQTDTTNFFMFGLDWGAVAGTQRFHFRNQSTLGSWTHENSGGPDNGLKAGPGTGGWLRLGDFTDYGVDGIDIAAVAIWAGTRFADGDYGTWTKTSDLWNHANGRPSFLCQGNATPVDLTGGSTYSSANSTGATLTGPDPTNWAFDGLGGGQIFVPHRMPMGC